MFFSRECGFGDPENLEPCSSSKCLLFSILRPSFHRSDFPGGITTFGLNRLSLYSSLNPVTSFTANLETVKFSRSGKIAALTHIVVGRESEINLHDLQVVRSIPPPNADSDSIFILCEGKLLNATLI